LTAAYDPLRPREALRRYGIRPRKDLGQNFLQSSEALQIILRAADLHGNETVLEIGPGLGALTLRLAEQAERVVAVEYDPRLLRPLQALLEGNSRVEVLHGDILELEWEVLGLDGEYCVIANIPYNITSALLRRLLEAPARARRLLLTVQREVADRIVAAPGKMSLLALSVQLYGTVSIAARLPAEAFYPQPEVSSAVLRIEVHPSPRVAKSRAGPLFRLARAGFAQRRKKLRNALAAGLAVRPEQAEGWLQAAGIDPDRRAQTLAIEDWLRLTEVFSPAEPKTV
jgi:16S rRNA (adenine1518-N6/adenine1519-N6)-dimethyltransferase